MDKERTKEICYSMILKLSCIIKELEKEKPYYGYLDEKLRPVENDIKCVREEIEGSK